jgi:antitoxin ParD1/3/4
MVFPTMKITLQPEQEKLLRSRLESGKYGSIEQIIDEALRLLAERDDRESDPRVEELRRQIAIATEQIVKGQVTDGEIVFDRLREKLRHEYGI